MARHGLLIGGVFGAALFLVPATLSAQQPTTGGQSPACADPLHTSGPCPAPAGQPGGADGDSLVRGKALFEGKGGCQKCHRVNAVGSRIAPDLTTIGSVLSAAELTQQLLDPNAALRPAVFSIRALTKDGKPVVGLRLNEDRYSVQFIDEQEHLRSLNKSDLREFAVLPTARMPSYRGKLVEQEIADLVSYLRSLK
jgi:putative heme-binding domain-containing protein